MEFIMGLLLTTRKKESIFMVVDTMTKSAHLIHMHTTYEVQYIARVLSTILLDYMTCQKGSYPIEDQCLQDIFGLVPRRPWGQN